MKKKIVILGSTGSIGKITFNLIKKNKKKFDIVLLSTNKNIKELIKQAKIFKVKNLIVNDNNTFLLAKQKFKGFNFYNSFSSIDYILKNKKIYYVMNSVVGLDGLYPTLRIIKYSKNIAIVNKESIICAWNLIKTQLTKHKSNFIPIDSEHFSIFSLIKFEKKSSIDQVILTASGGPFLNLKKNDTKHISIKDALNHPNWKMGKKITIDSSTMINKVFEVVEAKKIFDLKYNQIKIFTHPKSYIHALVKFNNGIIKLLAHEPNMLIPIFNSIYLDTSKKLPTRQIDLPILNNLKFDNVKKKDFPLIKILNLLPNNETLFETALVTINDYFVHKFLEKKINYHSMIKFIIKSVKSKSILNLRKKKVRKIDDIIKIKKLLSFKLGKICI